MNPQAPKQQSNLTEALVGAGEIMIGRPNGLDRIDLSRAGFLASFWGLGLSALMDMSVYSMRYSSLNFVDPAVAPSKLWYVAGNLGISFLTYAASLMMLFLLCRQPGEQIRFPFLIIVNNWASPLISLVALPLTVLFVGEGGNGSDLGLVFSVMFVVAILYADVNLIRISLGIRATRAFAYMLALVVISIICVNGLEQLFGLASQQMPSS